jgi:hypothetical protein
LLNIVKAIDTLTNVVGLYVLTPDGALGALGDGNRLAVDHAQTQTFGPQIRQLLKTYLGNPDGSNIRLGVVYHSPAQMSWSSDTLVMEEHVLREVYPVSGPTVQELTAFQKKNRVKSIYRGIELLVEYRYDRLADAPVYCPLLYDRSTTLDQYPAYSGLGEENSSRIPVMELLNLMAMLPLGRRNAPELLALMQNMHRYLVRKDMRRDGVFTLRQDVYVAPATDTAATVGFFDADKRHERKQTLMSGSLGQRLDRALQVPQSERFHQVEQWLERPHRPVDPALLRSFARFRNLDDTRLAALAEKALVHTAPGGVRLLDIGMKDSWNMYLLEGTVSLQAADGGTLLVTGGSDKAANPISFLKPRKYTVTSVTPVSFLWVHDALLQAVAVAPEAERDTSGISELKPFKS